MSQHHHCSWCHSDDYMTWRVLSECVHLLQQGGAAEECSAYQLPLRPACFLPMLAALDARAPPRDTAADAAWSDPAPGHLGSACQYSCLEVCLAAVGASPS